MGAGTAVVVVDVQRDFCEGGSLGVAGGTALARRLSQWLPARRAEGALVVATRDAHIDPGDHFSTTPDFVDSWPPHCVVGTPGQAFCDALTWRDFDAIVDKGQYAAAYSGFEGRTAEGIGLAEWLRSRGVERVEVVGIATDFCVDATVRDAVAEGFTTVALPELTAAVAPESVARVVERWRAAGVIVD